MLDEKKKKYMHMTIKKYIFKHTVHKSMYVSHSLRPVSRGLSVAKAVLWSAQRLPFCSLVKGDHCLHCPVCKKNIMLI